MLITLDNPPSAPRPVGPYSQVARIDLGDVTLLHLSGQVSVDASGALVGAGDVAAQTERIFETIRSLLAAHGAALSDVVAIRTYLLDLDLLSGYGRVRLAQLAGHTPTSTTVQVARLFLDGALLEVEVTAAVAGAGARR